jgi:hypothetical protein
MKRRVEQKCDIHENVFECPDNVIYYSQTLDEYGLIKQRSRCSKSYLIDTRFYNRSNKLTLDFSIIFTKPVLLKKVYTTCQPINPST